MTSNKCDKCGEILGQPEPGSWYTENPDTGLCGFCQHWGGNK